MKSHTFDTSPESLCFFAAVPDFLFFFGADCAFPLLGPAADDLLFTPLLSAPDDVFLFVPDELLLLVPLFAPDDVRLLVPLFAICDVLFAVPLLAVCDVLFAVPLFAPDDVPLLVPLFAPDDVLFPVPPFALDAGAV